LIREALQYLGDLRAAALEPIKLLDRADKKCFLMRDGTAVEVEIPPMPRAHRVNTIGDFAVAVQRWRKERSVVFHNEDGAVFLVDDASRLDTVLLPLPITEVWQQILELDKQTYDQRSFLRLLRHDLAGVIPPTLVSAIQKIEVVTSGNQRSEIQPGRERGTREFAADLAASGSIPEQVTCEVPVYRLPGLDYPVPIRFSLEYTLPPGPVTFLFRPLPDEAERCLLGLQSELHRMLVEAFAEQPIDVLYGSPEMVRK
jgi:hypothetical protein